MPSIHATPLPRCFAAQGLLMTLIAWRFNFNREAAKAMARTAAHQGPASGAEGGLRQPLLEGRRCERLEAGVLLHPAEPVEEEQLSAAQVVADAGQVPAASAAATAQRGRQRGVREGEASPKEERPR